MGSERVVSVIASAHSSADFFRSYCGTLAAHVHLGNRMMLETLKVTSNPGELLRQRVPYVLLLRREGRLGCLRHRSVR